MMSSSSSRNNSSSSDEVIRFGPFAVTEQVFLTTPLSFGLVNLKPLAPGHVLVCPRKARRRLTDLTAMEMADLFMAVQRTQRMLERVYLQRGGGSGGGSFTVAVQDGPEAGQTVPHVHVHVIPRVANHDDDNKDKTNEDKTKDKPNDDVDEIYARLASEKGNVGGALWDLHAAALALRHRPVPGGGMPRIEDEERVARTAEEMREEAARYREVLEGLLI